jgi:hypothetical protein
MQVLPHITGMILFHILFVNASAFQFVNLSYINFQFGIVLKFMYDQIQFNTLNKLLTIFVK